MITTDMQIAGMEASLLDRPSVDDESYVVSIYEAMERAAWVDVTDEMPMPGKPVQVYAPRDEFGVITAFWDGSFWDVRAGYLNPQAVTHWRSLCAPPITVENAS